MKKVMMLLPLALVFAGCYPTTFTHIERADEGTYVVTKTQAGFFRAHGEIWECKPAGKKMVCKEISTD